MPYVFLAFDQPACSSGVIPGYSSLLAVVGAGV